MAMSARFAASSAAGACAPTETGRPRASLKRARLGGAFKLRFGQPEIRDRPAPQLPLHEVAEAMPVECGPELVGILVC